MEDSSVTRVKKIIAIVGGGLSGIGSIVALTEEGHEPVCFEATDNIGGTWCYREEAVTGYASIMPTTVANNSKEMGAVSNFPPSKEFSNFMRHQDILKYTMDYVEHNDCKRYIRFNSEVTYVKKASDYGVTGRFEVTVKNKITGKVYVKIFDGVIIASGHFNYPMFPEFPEQDKFKGRNIHTHSLKHIDVFKDKNVLIVGMGCSGLDAAEVISSMAKKVYISARSGAFVLSRVGQNGYPSDYLLLRRYFVQLLDLLPVNLCSWFIEAFYLDTKFDHRLYFIQPKHHLLAKDPVLNDAIGAKLLTGFVEQKGNVKKFTENGVVFDGEDSETEIDDVIMATGYDINFPFLEEGLFPIEEGRINLYKCMYPVSLPHESLVFIGLVNPFGPGVPIGELQCRFAAQVFSGKFKLPSKEKMLDDVVKRHTYNQNRFVPSPMQSNRVDFLPYMDDLASLIGCKPNLVKYFFTDFTLFLKLMFGPCLSYQYRLEGPNKWNGAREAIMTCNERVNWPLVKNNKKTSAIQFILEFMNNIFTKNIFSFSDIKYA